MEVLGWESLPHEILVVVLNQLFPSDRFSASLVCHKWNQCFHLSYVWSRFTFRFVSPENAKCLQAVDGVGQFMQDVRIIVDQYEMENRVNACNALIGLARLPERKIRSLKIQFVGENPMLYGGQEFLDALHGFFEPSGNTLSVESPLRTVDLSGLNISVSGILLKALWSNHAQLTSLTIQSKSLVCKVSPDDILLLVTNCRQLTNLSMFYCSLSDEVLTALSKADRQPIKHLSLLCRWQDKFTKDVSSTSWSKLVRASPKLQVTLAFDHSCLMLTVKYVMKPEIPVVVLRLETFTELSEEIVRACSYYKKTLEKVIVECPKSHTSKDLDQALVKLSAECGRLRSLHVFCVLQQETVERILAEHPEMHREGRYTLKYIPEPHPWFSGRDCDE